jgi:hypothetical protein
MNVDGVDSDSEIDEAGHCRRSKRCKTRLASKKSGDLYNSENVDHKVEDLYFFAFCEKKASKTVFSYFLLVAPL